MAFSKFQYLYDLFCNIMNYSKYKNDNMSTHYVNQSGFGEMMDAIPLVIKRKSVEAIRNSPMISVLCDESRCNSNNENLLIFIKNSKTVYLDNIRVKT